MNIGSKLKEARMRTGMTQEQAAEAAKVSRQTMSSWENGRSIPDIVSAAALAGIYGISLDSLAGVEQQEEQISFLEERWEVLYSAAVATLPLSALAEHFFSTGTAVVVLLFGALLFAVPRVLSARVIGGWKNVVLSFLGWGLIVLRKLGFLLQAPSVLTSFAGVVGLILVLYIRQQETGSVRSLILVLDGRKQGGDAVRKNRWHNWAVLALILAAYPLIALSETLDSGNLNRFSPFLHLYRVEAVEYGEMREPVLAELGKDTLHLLDPGTDTTELIGSFVYLEPTEAEAATLAGTWLLVPEERTEELYRLTAQTDGEIRLSFLINEELQWRYRLVRADLLRWNASTSGQFTGGIMDYYPAGTFDGRPERLNASDIFGKGTVSILCEEPVEQLTLNEYRYHDGQLEERSITLNTKEPNGLDLELESRYPGEEYAIYSIPWADGAYWFRVDFE